jgi:hypothetical protein
VGLLLVRIVVLLVAIRAGMSGPLHDDLERFRQLFMQPGLPYRDFPVEYAPLEVVIVRLFGSASAGVLASRVAVIACLADVGAWLAIRWGWDRAAAVRYLWLGTPLLLFIYTRLDLVPVALAVWGAALAMRGRERAGGAALAAAALTKLWPVVVLPGLRLERRSRALRWAASIAAIGVAVWAAIGGVAGIRAVVTFRGASGWGVESIPGSVVWVITGGPVRIEAGAPRVGTVPSGATVALALLLAAGLIAIWLRAQRIGAQGFGAPSVAAVGALLACAPLFSLQYVAWLLPWGALAGTEDRRLFRVVGAIQVLTAILFAVYAPDRVVASQVLLVLRNVAVLSLPILWLVSTSADVPTKVNA